MVHLSAFLRRIRRRLTVIFGVSNAEKKGFVWAIFTCPDGHRASPFMAFPHYSRNYTLPKGTRRNRRGRLIISGILGTTKWRWIKTWDKDYDGKPFFTEELEVFVPCPPPHDRPC